MNKRRFQMFMREGDQLWWDYRRGKITSSEFQEKLDERTRRFSEESNRSALQALAIVVVIMALCYAASYLLPK